VCGCYYCCQTLEYSEIQEWIDHKQTALCPYCGIDSVIGAASGIEITLDFLKEAHFFGFATGTRKEKGTGIEECWVDERFIKENEEWVKENPRVSAFLDKKRL